MENETETEIILVFTGLIQHPKFEDSPIVARFRDGAPWRATY